MTAEPKQRKARGFGGGVGLQTVRSNLNPKSEDRRPKEGRIPKAESTAITALEWPSE
jgi:hypothetical protein